MNAAIAFVCISFSWIHIGSCEYTKVGKNKKNKRKNLHIYAYKLLVN